MKIRYGSVRSFGGALKKGFKSRSNKDPNREMKKHTPSRRHKGGKK